MRELRQVGHEDPRQVDHVSAAGTDGDDRQAEEHAVGIGQMDRPLLRAPLRRGEADVAADDLDLVVHLAELPKPIVPESPAHAAEDRILADAVGDGDQDDEIAIQQIGTQFGKELVLFAVQLDQAVNAVRVLEHFREGGKVRFGATLSAPRYADLWKRTNPPSLAVCVACPLEVGWSFAGEFSLGLSAGSATARPNKPVKSATKRR